jgi:hypothetical protein
MSFGQSFVVSGHRLGPATNFSFSSMEIIVRHLQFFIMECPLWREDRSIIFSAAVPQSEPRRTRNHALLSHLGLRYPYLYPPGTGGRIIPPGTGFTFCHLLQLVGIHWSYSIRPPHCGTQAAAPIGFIKLLHHKPPLTVNILAPRISARGAWPLYTCTASWMVLLKTKVITKKHNLSVYGTSTKNNFDCSLHW